MRTASHLKNSRLRQLFLVAICSGVLGLQTSSAEIFQSALAMPVNLRLEKGERFDAAVAKLLASAKENDRMELDPAKKGFSKVAIEVRDPDLILSKDLDLTNLHFGDAVNRLCEATGGAFLMDDCVYGSVVLQGKFIFFRNSETAIHDVFYELPPSLSEHLIPRMKAEGYTPGPGECVLDHSMFTYVPVRGGNRCQAVLKKLVAEPVR